MRKNAETHILHDIAPIVLSVLVAILLVKTGVLATLLSSLQGSDVWGPLIAGMFFTTIFTTAPAIAALGTISLLHGVFFTALFGAIGSALGDLLLFSFFHEHFVVHINEMLSHERMLRRIHLLFKRRFFRWITIFIGGVILASPLPDEPAIALLGLSRVPVVYFTLLSFVFNFLGILLIGLAAHSLAGG